MLINKCKAGKPRSFITLVLYIVKILFSIKTAGASEELQLKLKYVMK